VPLNKQEINNTRFTLEHFRGKKIVRYATVPHDVEVWEEIGWDGVDWVDLAQDRDHWRALVNTVMNLRVP
jgi:hypothetical protein